MPEPHRGLGRAALVALACLAFMVAGPVLIVVNKRIMNEAGFPFPIMLSSLGVISSMAVAHAAVFLGFGKIDERNAELLSGVNWYRRVLPLGVMQALTLVFGNWVYMYLGVGFIQMLKAGTPVLVLISMVAFRLETPTLPVVGCVLLIFAGTLATTWAAPEWIPMGLALMLGSNVCEAVRLVLTQYLMASRKLSVLEGQYILSPAGSACLVAAAAVLELPQALRTGAFWVVLADPRIFIWAAALGVGVNYLSYLVIQGVGTLTLKVLSTLRNIGLIVYGLIFLDEVVNMRQVLGYGAALVGFVGYNYLQGAERRRSSKRSKAE